LAPERIATTATVSLEKLEAGWTLTAVHLDVTAKIPNATVAAFEAAAGSAKSGCPISRVLNTKITMDAKLEQ
jgi:lipoyl-dependent peroxiredoxin